MGGVLKIIGDSMFPKNITCDICGRETFDGRNLCPECAKKVTFIGDDCCPICGRKTKTRGVCLECKAYTPTYDAGVSAFVYRDGGAQLILKFKRGGEYLKDYFADLLAPKLKKFPLADGVCFIPMTAKAERRRGYNQAELLAKEISARLNLPVVCALEKVKDTNEQKALTKRERQTNLKGCFSASKKDVAGRRLILVDDVMTTGATAEEAARVLKKKGAEAVYFASAASVEYDGPI